MTLKERRQIARAAGLCGCCRARHPAPGRKTCEVCLQPHRIKNTAIGDINICCQSHGVHRFDCGESATRAAGPYRRRAA